MEQINLRPKLFSQTHSSTSQSSLQSYAFHQEPVIQSDMYISVVSNSYLLREALILLLKAHQPIHLIHSYTGDVDIDPLVIQPTVSHLLEHCILLDSGIGRDLTMTRIQQWRSLNPSPYVVVLELSYGSDLILDYIEAGANAYALQGASSIEIAQIIRQVYQGAFQCSAEITAQLFHRLSQPKKLYPPREKPPLTRRELEVLHYVAKEYSDRDIAAQLVVEVRTVKHHVHNILQKLNVKHRWDAAQFALKHGWLDLTS